MRRPAARYSELAFTFTAGLMLAGGVAAAWPDPALDVSPLYCPTAPPRPLVPPGTPEAPQTPFQPRSGERVGGLPPSYERYTR